MNANHSPLHECTARRTGFLVQFKSPLHPSRLTREQYAFTVFERLFKERGLPANIRSDNGVPFASAHALFNLSKFAVWWLRLGIGIERIKPGHPQQTAAMNACISR
jgi:putative transposase